MIVLSTNIAKPQFIELNGRKEKTGIFKKPIKGPIHLGKEVVRGDEVSNRKVHGGEFKACYLFASESYDYWEDLYPNLDWHYGMIGENLTVSGLDESKLIIGDVYKIGKALVQITQPREPCATFGNKLGDMQVLKHFVKHGKPGTYVRVLKEGEVKKGDKMKLVESATNSISILDFFKLIFDKDKSQEHLKLIMNIDALPQTKRNKLKHLIE